MILYHLPYYQFGSGAEKLEHKPCIFKWSSLRETEQWGVCMAVYTVCTYVYIKELEAEIERFRLKHLLFITALYFRRSVWSLVQLREIVALCFAHLKGHKEEKADLSSNCRISATLFANTFGQGVYILCLVFLSALILPYLPYPPINCVQGFTQWYHGGKINSISQSTLGSLGP